MQYAILTDMSQDNRVEYLLDLCGRILQQQQGGRLKKLKRPLRIEFVHGDSDNLVVAELSLVAPAIFGNVDAVAVLEIIDPVANVAGPRSIHKDPLSMALSVPKESAIAVVEWELVGTLGITHPDVFAVSIGMVVFPFARIYLSPSLPHHGSLPMLQIRLEFSLVHVSGGILQGPLSIFLVLVPMTLIVSVTCTTVSPKNQFAKPMSLSM